MTQVTSTPETEEQRKAREKLEETARVAKAADRIRALEEIGAISREYLWGFPVSVQDRVAGLLARAGIAALAQTRIRQEPGLVNGDGDRLTAEESAAYIASGGRTIDPKARIPSGGVQTIGPVPAT